jgi:Kae1-associated kinase Bud32
MTNKIIAQGAEAIISLDTSQKTITKNRISKSYRLPSLDKKIRARRTKSEAKNLERASPFIPVPKVISSNNSDLLEIEHIEGLKLSEHLDSLKDKLEVSETIGKHIALLHNNNIIHGDLTTSNMILRPDNKLFFIDFGLSFHSTKIEDKAVDLHLIKQALEAKHNQCFEDCFKAITKAYTKHSTQSKEILNRLEKVEQRGRYKGNY